MAPRSESTFELRLSGASFRHRKAGPAALYTKDSDRTSQELRERILCSTKGNTPAAELLDPFEVEDGWFEIHLPSLQLRVSKVVPDQFRERAEHVLSRMRLRDDERVMRQRSVWYCLYQSGELTLEGLEKVAPLNAAAIVRA